ncbi:hypothetical protein GCM10009549_31590 [Streptomyces thermoalcalitolerans]|uniref:Uncharacterized protein n=1 Tax=Streptomyces thermoalcalitolerans TaxID=65605 RepID=A0ABP3Z5W6_9ACTN
MGPVNGPVNGPVKEGAPDRHEDLRAGHRDVTPHGSSGVPAVPPRRPSAFLLRSSSPDGRPLYATWPSCGLGHRDPADQDPGEAIA